jgi:hypothetical protein
MEFIESLKTTLIEMEQLFLSRSLTTLIPARL